MGWGMDLYEFVPGPTMAQQDEEARRRGCAFARLLARCMPLGETDPELFSRLAWGYDPKAAGFMATFHRRTAVGWDGDQWVVLYPDGTMAPPPPLQADACDDDDN